MSGIVYTLLVGIDSYPAPVPPLRGCVNDITAIEQLLAARLPADKLKAKILQNAEATRQAVIAGFDHLRLAGADDVALFYYSGHGSQERTPPEFWHLEPDRLDETLVCYDSRLPGNYDLADKELAKLIAAVAARGAHVLVILDSCHSGSGTRAAETEGVRRVPADLRERPLKTFLVTSEEAAAMAVQGESREVAGTPTGWVKLPQGRHIVMAACRDDEEAKEFNDGGVARGAFSYFLTETLQRAEAGMTYRDLFKRVNALVRTKAAGQSPLIEAAAARELDQPFLGGAIQSYPPYFTVSFDAGDGWLIDGGAVHGIEPVNGDETTLLALFSVDARPEQLGYLQAAIGVGRVTERRPTRSKVAVQLGDNQQPDPGTTYKAVITAMPLAPRSVQIAGDGPSITLARAALNQAGPTGGPSLLVRESADEAELKLIATDNGFRIQHGAAAQPIVVEICQPGAAGARQAVERLEHIARWLRVAELSNSMSRIKTDDVELSIELLPDANAPADAKPQVLDAAEQGRGLRLVYAYNQGEWEEPRFRVKIKNNGKQRLYCILLDLTGTYKITSELLPGGGVWLGPSAETYALAGEPIFASVPDELWEQGVGEIKDLLKLIVSTDECDATLLDQDELGVSVKAAATRSVTAPRNTLERLMLRTTRALSARPQRDRLADWTTMEVGITTVRPLRGVQVPDAGQVQLLPQVNLVGHPTFKAQARLSTLPQAMEELKVSYRLSRAAEGATPGRNWLPPNLLQLPRLPRLSRLPRLPRLLSDEPAVVHPLQFSAGRSGEPGLSVLELTNVDAQTVDSVTALQPLIVRIDQSLVAENEHILPVAYDGEFFLPLGRARRTAEAVEVELERLPTPLVDSRSLTGSIRIFFEKVVIKKLGLEFRYPLLAVAEADGRGAVTYDHNRDHVRARVTAAQRILLYIHGIIGDTRWMAASARHQLMADPSVAHLADRYDLILSFDYENLDTTIEENARLLKQRLEEAGLGPGHGKTFHVVAHSMGGLISRWFIEREGGNQVVQHLVMLGTPNGGSPWSAIEDWAVTALAIGLNGLSVAAWPASILGSLVKGIEKIDVSLDQMNPESEFLKELAAGPDPGVQYTIVAGNTSLITPPDEQQQSRLQRLLIRLKPQRALHELTALAFFGAPNDIAVSVASIRSAPEGRLPAPRKSEVACDHLSYFSTEAGLQALAEALE
jgi:pimeloyl-ACP methyl ester carboxylesterase